MTLTLTSLAADCIPIDLEGLTPDSVAALTLHEICRWLVRRGNAEVELGELFRVGGDPADRRWQLEGDFSAVHSLAAGMSAGAIIVDGPIGRHAGAGMRGGRLEIRGNAGDWLGAEMRGGTIRLRGDADNHVGGAYRGSRRGMAGGEILIDGNAGDEVGGLMRRGLIAVAGSVGQWLGMRMLAGSIFVFGKCADHPGSGMRRGTIGIFGGERPKLSPTFRGGFRGPLPVLDLIEKHLHGESFAPPRLRLLAGMIELFHGDMLERGRGEVLMPV